MNPFHHYVQSRHSLNSSERSILKQTPNGLRIDVSVSYHRCFFLALRLAKQAARARLPRKASTSADGSCLMSTVHAARSWLV